MDHPLDLRCHPLPFVCSLFEVKGEGELIGKVVIEMVGEVTVEMVREVVVHLSRHCHHYHRVSYLHHVGYIKVRHLYRFLSPSAHVLLSFCVK